MAKEKPPADSEEKRLKKEKKEKKRSETDGVHKSSSKKDRSDKKEKKEKKESSKKDHMKSVVVIEDAVADDAEAPATTNGAAVRETAADEMQMTTQLLNTLEAEKPGSVVIKEQDRDVDVKVRGATGGLLGALVPFANPLADEKAGKKVLKGVRRGMSIHPSIGLRFRVSCEQGVN